MDGRQQIAPRISISRQAAETIKSAAAAVWRGKTVVKDIGTPKQSSPSVRDLRTPPAKQRKKDAERAAAAATTSEAEELFLDAEEESLVAAALGLSEAKMPMGIPIFPGQLPALAPPPMYAAVVSGGATAELPPLPSNAVAPASTEDMPCSQPRGDLPLTQDVPPTMLYPTPASLPSTLDPLTQSTHLETWYRQRRRGPCWRWKRQPSRTALHDTERSSRNSRR